MTEFVNRRGINLNKKILEVEEVTRDDSGEIINLLVKEIRNDLPVAEEGTPLNAESMNSIIGNMISENTYQIFDSLMAMQVISSAQILARDKYLLTLPNEVFRDFVLPTRGFCGSTIDWPSVTGDTNAFTRDGNVIHIHRLQADAYIYLLANIHKIYDETDQKSFTVTVKRYIDDATCVVVNETVDVISYNDTISESDYLCEEIVDNTDVVIYNSYPSHVNVLYRIEDNYLYYCVQGTHDLSQTSITMFPIIIRMESRENGNTMKRIQINAYNIESTDPDD